MADPKKIGKIEVIKKRQMILILIFNIIEWYFIVEKLNNSRGVNLYYFALVSYISINIMSIIRKSIIGVNNC